MNTTEMMVICREVDRATGKIAVYQIKTEVTESLIDMYPEFWTHKKLN